jgi:hypothetical protein
MSDPVFEVQGLINSNKSEGVNVKFPHSAEFGWSKNNLFRHKKMPKGHFFYCL